MKFVSQHILKISTISPVHVGCNETYEPTNYIIDQGALFSFDSLSVLNSLSNELRSNLLGVLNGQPNDVMLKQVQSLFYDNRKLLIPNATHVVPVHSNIEAFYRKRIGKTAHSEGKGKNVINKLEIERTAFNPVDHSLYLPGSGIKGAIRTALLNKINNGNKLTNKFEKNIDLQQRLFGYRKFENDPMRLISVADAHSSKNSDISFSELNFAVNRKRKLEDKDGKPIITIAESKGLNQILESISPLQYQVFKTQLNIQNVNQVLSTSNISKLPNRSFLWTMEEIAEACNKFYFPLFNKEIESLKELGYVNEKWANTIQELLLRNLPKIGNNKLFLLRIGRHSGAEAETLNGVRNIKIMQGRNKNPKYLDNPTTFWLASNVINSKTNMIPFGWILVEINKDGNRDLEKYFDDSGKKRLDWLKEKHAYQNKLVEDNILKQKALEKSILEEEKKETQEKIAKEQWGKMMDQEKEIAIVQGNEIVKYNLRNFDPIQVIWPKIDTFPEVHKQAIANAFKERWKFENKWQGKLSKKQNIKVQKIKEILCEH